jgi:hypothetical protein
MQPFDQDPADRLGACQPVHFGVGVHRPSSSPRRTCTALPEHIYAEADVELERLIAETQRELAGIAAKAAEPLPAEGKRWEDMSADEKLRTVRTALVTPIVVAPGRRGGGMTVEDRVTLDIRT